MKCGTTLIKEERTRQIKEEKWTAKHDDETHANGDLALAAICYAAPEDVYIRSGGGAFCFDDPWPWENKYDKRLEYGQNKITGSNKLPDPNTYTHQEHIDLLVKAGALIAAEIDLLQIRQFPKRGER